MVGHHRHTIATVPCILAMVECCHCLPLRYDVHWLAPLQYHVVIACSLAIRCKNCIIVARSSQYDIKNTIVVIITMLVACIIAIRQNKNINVVASCKTSKIRSRKRRRKSPIIAKSKATSQRLRVWWAFWTSFQYYKRFKCRCRRRWCRCRRVP